MKNEFCYALKYIQNGNQFYSTVLSFEILNKITKTLVYSKNEPYGYQREINDKHYRKIVKELKQGNRNISPNSIILGVNEKEIERQKLVEYLDDNLCKLYIPSKIDNIIQLFRTVDGQHRLKALEIASQEIEKLNDYPLNVIIMVIKEGNRYKEVETFVNINSKAKPVKTDLSILAEYNYQILEEKKDIDYNKNIAVRCAFKLNEEIEESVWKKAIKIEVNKKGPSIIGVKTFYESIKAIIENYIEYNKIKPEEEFKENIEVIEKISDEICNKYINECWNIIKEEWKECFKNEVITFEGEDYKVYYNTDYYIQKAMGTKAINRIISKCYEAEKDFHKAKDIFKTCIKRCNLSAEDWKKGGRFSGLSSESGINKIVKIMLGEN